MADPTGLIAPGALVAGRFAIEETAGAGGMGTVYRARDRTTGDLVALKICRRATYASSDMERFRREASVLSGIRHPNIVSYVAHGETEAGDPFLAMEFLSGETLAQRLERRPLSLADVVSLGSRVARALRAAYERGVVHRDIKPSNLFLCAGRIDQVRLLDFGVATTLATRDVLTRTGAIIGTPAYMAPEQARGEREMLKTGLRLDQADKAVRIGKSVVVDLDAELGESTMRIGGHNQSKLAEHASLTVNGKVVAREILVTDDSWADHVFADEYALMSLPKVAEFIRDHDHLPGVRSRATAGPDREGAPVSPASGARLAERVRRRFFMTFRPSFSLPFLIALSLAAPATGGAATAEPPALDDAVKSAVAAHQPLIVEFGTSWCKPCKMFEADILPRPEVQEALAGVTFVRYDAEAGPGLAAAARHSVTSFPTFLVLDAGGIARSRSGGFATGAEGAGAFVAFVRSARLLVAEEDAVRANVAKAPADAAARLAAARWYMDRGRPTEALPHLDVVAIVPAPDSLHAEAASSAAKIRRLDAWRKQLVSEKLELLRRYPAMPGALGALSVIASDGSASPAELDALFSAVIAETKNPGALNDLLYTAIAAGAKDAALAGARKLEAVASRMPPLLDTVAEVYHARGDRTEALRVEDKAIAVGPNWPGLKENRERFASTTDDADEVTAERKRLAGLWKRLEIESNLDAPAVAPPLLEMQAFSAATRKLGEQAGAACKAAAGKQDEAWVRLRVGAAAGPPTEVTVLEPGVSSKLASCLNASLRSAQLPKPPSYLKGRTVFAVPFAETH